MTSITSIKQTAKNCFTEEEVKQDPADQNTRGLANQIYNRVVELEKSAPQMKSSHTFTSQAKGNFQSTKQPNLPDSLREICRPHPLQGKSPEFDRRAMKASQIATRYEVLNINSSYDHLHADTKVALAARFAGGWTNEDKSADYARWSKKVLDGTDQNYKHIDKTTRELIVHYTIEGDSSLNMNTNPDIAKKIAARKGPILSAYQD